MLKKKKRLIGFLIIINECTSQLWTCYQLVAATYRTSNNSTADGVLKKDPETFPSAGRQSFYLTVKTDFE